MNMHRVAALVVALLCCLALVGVVLAQGSPHYGLSWTVVAEGGGTSQSPHYTLSGTGGQGAPGAAASGHYRVGSGFWYAFGIPVLPGHKLYLPLILRQRL